jgi:hypothetical protein
VFTDAQALKAWMHLLLTANHEDKRMFFDGKLITIKRGQHLTSIRKLAESWGCTRRKADSLLNCFIEDQMVTVKRSNKGTLLTLVNYSVYQNMRDTESTTERTTESTTEDTTESTQTTMNNNDNNDNNKREREPLPEIKAPKFPTGKYNNVMLTQMEAAMLNRTYGVEAPAMIEKLSEYMETSGKKYANHYAVICKWIHEDREKAKQEPKKNNAALNYTQRQYTDADIAAIERKKLGLQ